MSKRGSDEYNLSASQIKTGSQCMLQWEFEYRRDVEPGKGESVYLRLGSRVHEAIEETLTAENPPPLGHTEALKAGFQAVYAEMDEYPLPDDHYSDGMEYLETAAKYINKRSPDIRDVESKTEFRIDRDDIETGVTAIMDIATETEIWDWKTGRIRDETAHEEKIQGSVYMAAYLNEYGEKPEAIRFVYLKEEKVRTVEPEDEVWEYMIERAKDLVVAKEQDKFPATTGEHCYWCPYEFHCEVAPVGFGNVPPEDY